MLANKGKDNLTELRLRRALHARGLRYFVHRRPVEGVRCAPDLVFPGIWLAVFLDGCFWHRCPEHQTAPVTNGDWWRAKLDRNQARDGEHNQALEAAGWSVLRIWEHQPLAEAVDLVVRRVEHEHASCVARTLGP